MSQDRPTLLVTGGAGFVGSTLAIGLRRRHPDWTVVAFDNLRRRGSELALPRLAEAGITFVHGDVRMATDLAEACRPTVVLDCSAEPSVLAGLDGNPSYVVDTNLQGTLHCLELARRHGAAFVFLSTSRVYPIAALEALPFVETDTRFELVVDPSAAGQVTTEGVTESFSLAGARSIYGATKLASELMITEYVAAYGLRAVIDRCGVLAGPWQMGKVDQGVITHWVASHVFGRPLRYVGYGGLGKQVRDVLHVDDLLELVDAQIAVVDTLDGGIFNVGGGRSISTSLAELTALCQAATGRTVEMSSVPETRAADVRIYLGDAGAAKARFGWAPTRSVERVVDDVARFVTDHREALARALGGG